MRKMDKNQEKLDLGIEARHAIFSDCHQFRYVLMRIWDEKKPKCMFIMLNPSIADAAEDDRTVTRCIGFAKAWGYGSLYICNLYPFVSTKPEGLLSAENPLGNDNIQYLKKFAPMSKLIVLAWGNGNIVKKLQKRFPDYLPLNVIPKSKMHYLRLSADGTPWHPLYLPSKINPTKY